MAKKITISLEGNETEMLLESINDRVQFLTDTAAGLMKKKLTAGADPLYKDAERLKNVGEQVRDNWNAQK